MAIEQKCTLSDSSDCYIEIIELIEEKVDEEQLKIDIDGFEIIKYYFEKYNIYFNDIKSDLFLKRVALMTLDVSAYLYLSLLGKEELNYLINDISSGYHPLMAAVNRYDYPGVEYLLKNGANPNEGTEPWFPLLQADQNNDEKMVKLLENYGADWKKCKHVYQVWRNKAYIKKT